jgi:DNA-binding winged helix-turn-helix (wHTH) protein
VRFGEFELDLSTRELWANGSKQTLAPQPFQVLQLLIEHRGVLVTREMLIARLWPSDIFVDYEQGLKKAVARLRENLSDSADKPRFIENLPRQGYRFIAELEFDTAEQTPVYKSFVLYPHLVEGEESSHAKKRKPFPVSLVIASLLHCSWLSPAAAASCFGGVVHRGASYRLLNPNSYNLLPTQSTTLSSAAQFHPTENISPSPTL